MRMLPRLLGAGGMVFASLLSAGCADTPTAPSTGAVATIQVVGEIFHVWLQSEAQIAAAYAAYAGGRANIPVGRIVAGTEYNIGYSWHLEDVTFAEVTIEVCDGLPSHVEREGVAFGNGRYCPWSARVIAIDD